RQELAEGIGSLLGWRKGVRQKKIETHQKIIGGSRKAFRDVGQERGRRGGECRGNLQVLGQDRRAEAKKLHKTDVNELLIKIVESGGLRVDAGVLDQGTR
ncbi:hypothetical protein B296_00039710, partial [Ensete ventricosum]